MGDFIERLHEIHINRVVLPPLSSISVHWSKTNSNCRVVDLPDMKPNLFLLNSLFLFICSTLWFLTSFSIILHAMLVTYWPVVARIGLISLLKQSHYIANLPYFRYFCFLLRGNKYPCLKLFVVLLRKIRVLLVPSAKFGWRQSGQWPLWFIWI